MVVVWSLLNSLTRNTLGVMSLRVRGEAAKDIEIMVLRHQLTVLQQQVNRPAAEPADQALRLWLRRSDRVVFESAVRLLDSDPLVQTEHMAEQLRECIER